MKAITPLLILAALTLPAAAAAKPRLMVHLSRCSGPELKKDQVLVVDVSAFPNPQKELQRVLDEHHLMAIRERTISDFGSSKRSLAKVAKTAGEERCDAVIVLHRGTDTNAMPLANVGKGTRVNGSQASVTISPNLIEVVFAELKPVPEADATEKKEGG